MQKAENVLQKEGLKAANESLVIREKIGVPVNGIKDSIANYYLDFIITHNDGRREFVEVKGMETEAWRMKWAILEATFDRFKTGPDDSLTVIKQTNWGKPSFMRRLSPRR